MYIKASVEIHGVRQDIFIDPNKDWVAIQLTSRDRAALTRLTDNELFIAAPHAVLINTPKLIVDWARQWRTRFFSGSAKPPEGSILMPDGSRINQDGN